MTTNTDLHQALSDDELDVIIHRTLLNAGVDLADLRQQAHEGRFRSEKLRRTWFVIAGLGRG